SGLRPDAFEGNGRWQDFYRRRRGGQTKGRSTSTLFAQLAGCPDGRGTHQPERTRWPEGNRFFDPTRQSERLSDYGRRRRYSICQIDAAHRRSQNESGHHLVCSLRAPIASAGSVRILVPQGSRTWFARYTGLPAAAAPPDNVERQIIA